MTTKRILSATFAALLLAACSQNPSTSETSDHSAYTEVSPDQLEQLMNAGVALAYDANSADTRSEYGVVPGANMLTSSKSYDVGTELTNDKSKQIVFYCANTMCSAAPTAAQRANRAG
jgi:hypothetical protein